MIDMILQKPQTNGIEIDLTGPQGNAFFLLGMAKKLATQLDFPQEFILNDHYFGSVVTLYR
jgi:hypothetical protein